MRFISPHPRYSIQIQEAEEQLTATGRVVVTRKPTIANFVQGGLSPWEVEAALETFVFRGLPEGVKPTNRMAYFDTETISRDPSNPVRVEVEKRLMEADDYGRDFIMVEKPRRRPPWPNYDRYKDPVKIAAQVVSLGFTEGPLLDEVVAYEYENLRRPEVLEALEELRVNPDIFAEVEA